MDGDGDNSREDAPPPTDAEREELPSGVPPAADLTQIGDKLARMTAVNEPNCSNCHFWREHTAPDDKIRIGLCHRFPPTIYPLQTAPDLRVVVPAGHPPRMKVTQTWGLLPETRGEIWCGEHKPKAEAYGLQQ